MSDLPTGTVTFLLTDVEGSVRFWEATLCFDGAPEPGAVERLLLDAVAIWREIGDRRNLAYSLSTLGSEYMRTGRLAEAKRLRHEGIRIAVEIGDTWGTLQELVASAVLAVEQGRLERALRLEGAARALGTAKGVPIAASFGRWASPYLARAREALGPTASRLAQAEGQAMTVEQAVEYALAE